MKRPAIGLAGPRPLALGAGLIGLAAWAISAVVEPAFALRGWLIGFLFISSLSLGGLAAVLIQRLTGGRWGEAFGPMFQSAARATPLLLLFALPILIGLPSIYPWAGAPGGVDASVHRYFLNPTLFILRSVVALVGWSAVAIMLPRIEGPRGRLGAGLALAFYGVAVSVVAVDWILSVLPGWTSSNFGMDLAVQQLASAFAWAGLRSRSVARGRTGSGPADRDNPVGDLAGLLFATLIGLIYLEFMSYLVVWYGDRPSLDAWYLTRARAPWQALCWISLALSAAAVVSLMVRRRIGTDRAVTLASGATLAGLLSYQAWLLAPSLGAQSLAPGACALVAQGGLWLAAVNWPPRPARRAEGLAHG